MHREKYHGDPQTGKEDKRVYKGLAIVASKFGAFYAGPPFHLYFSNKAQCFVHLVRGLSTPGSGWMDD